MDREDGSKLLGAHDSLFVTQTKRGCVQELLGCEATNEFKIFPSKDEADGTETIYSLEESTFLMRMCCSSQRAFTQTVWAGSKDSRGPVIMTMQKKWTCPVVPCTCCCVPAVHYKAADVSALGSADVPMFYCLPKVHVRGPSGETEFLVQQPSCMGGQCVDPTAEGCWNCRVPMYIYLPGSKGNKGEEVGMHAISTVSAIASAIASPFISSSSFHLFSPLLLRFSGGQGRQTVARRGHGGLHRRRVIRSAVPARAAE